MAFDIHQRVFDEDGEYSEKEVDRYIGELMDLFAASPEGQELMQQGSQIGWADSFMMYGIDYFSAMPPDLSPQEVEEIVFEIFPSKLSADAESGGEIVRVLRGFWTFLQREFHLANAATSLKMLTPGAERRLTEEMGNPANFGMAKSFMMEGRARGFDMTTQEDINTFMGIYNAELAAGIRSPQRRPPLSPESIHIVPFDELDTPSSHPHRADKATAARRKMARNSRRKNRKKK